MIFQVTKDWMTSETGAPIPMYGLKTQCGEHFAAIHSQREPVQQIADTLNQSDLAEVHQMDVLQDLVQQLYMD
ncbi:MAG: hypothetical protein H9882_06085 [Candidatus Fournierella pullistercoris]|uniref:Uncharacterized protein n=1 Tax=Candidatus Allofournierella pullistercoris TaxID=2838597 RepID=A0A948T3A6_9FIRM|nr:hypothetical protein [Candidatus Fournierella pullistercoris]